MPPSHPFSLLSSLQMLLHLFSDANYNLLGFNATYSFSVCPGACGGHGRCDTASSLCQCHLGWGGADCSTPLCPQACILHGTCDKVRRGRETLLSTLETAVFRQHTGNVLVYYSAIKQRLVSVRRGLKVDSQLRCWRQLAEGTYVQGCLRS